MRSQGRNAILPEIVTEVPAFADFVSAIDEVLWQYVDEPALLFLDLRNLSRDSDRYILKQGASLLGFNKKNYFLDEERLARVINQLPKFRSQNTTDAYKNFLGFLVRYRMGIDELWTDDYFGFFSVPYGSKLISDLGVRLEETGPAQGWYNTTHVLIRANPRAIFPDSETPFEDLKHLFEAVAPAYLVLEFIGNIADPFHETLQLNVGVVEGFSIEEYKFTYENMRLTGSDWSRGRDLPVPTIYHGQSKIHDGRVLVTGGKSGNYRGEKIAYYLDLSQSKWLSRDIPFADTAVVTGLAYDPTNAVAVAGSSLGELAISKDGGDTWTKVWSPFYEEREVIIGLAYSEANKTFLALGDQGFYVRTGDPSMWAGDMPTLGETMTGLVVGPFYMAFTAAGAVFTSLDGLTWTRVIVQEGFVAYAGCYDSDRGQFLLVGKCGKAFFTTNGAAFTEVNVGVGDYDLTWAQFSIDAGAYVIGGNNATYATSNDGKVWKLRETLFRTTNITIGGYLPWMNQYVAAGEGKYATSGDGVTWNLYTTPFKSNVDGSVIMPTCFTTIPSARRIIVGGAKASINVSNLSEKVIRVEDMNDRRSNHAQLTLPSGKAFLAGGQRDGDTLASTVEFNPDGEVWTAKASISADRKNAGISYIPATDTASNWTPRSSKFGLSTIRDFEYLTSADKFIAVGDLGRISESKYGLTWTRIDSPFPVHQLVNAVYNPNTDRFTIISNSTPDLTVLGNYSLDDGLTWTRQSIGFPSNKLVGDFAYLPRKPPDVFMMTVHVPTDEVALDPATVPELQTAYGIRPNLPTVIRTRNGRDWVSDDITTETGIETRSVYDAFYSTKLQRYFAAVDGGVAYSDDGNNWLFAGWELAANASGTVNSIDPFIPWVAVAEGNGALMAQRADGVMLISFDGGQSWSAGLGVDDNYPLGSLTSSFDFSAHVANNYYTRMRGDLIYVASDSRWVAITPEKGLYESTDDGVTWNEILAPGFSPGFHFQLIELNEPSPSAWTNPQYVVYTDGVSSLKISVDGGEFASTITKTLTRGAITQNNISAMSYYKPTDSLLVGGNYLWRMKADLQASDAVTSSTVIDVAFARGPTLRSSFVSGSIPRTLANYQITCLDGVGESRASPVLIVDIPQSTTGVGVSLAWDRVPDARGYRIYGRRAGSMRFMAEVGPTITSFVDDGSVVPDQTRPLPLNDTSGLKTTTAVISVVSYVESLGMTFVGTENGHLAWSRDLVSWYGVLNPAKNNADLLQQQAGTLTALPPYPAGYQGMGFMTAILARESNNQYIVAGESGNVGLSLNSDSWDYSVPDAGVGDLKSIAYSEQRDEAVIGSNAGKFLVSRSRAPLISSTTVLETDTANNSLSAGAYRYWMVKEIDGEYTKAGAASEPWIIVDGTSVNAKMSWPRDARAEYYRVYRQRQSTGDPTFPTPDSIQYIGRLPNPLTADPSFADKWSTVSASKVFTGSGPDDITIDSSVLTGSEIRKVTVRVSQTGTPDRVQIRYDDGEYEPEVAVVDTPGWIVLQNNARIRFGALTGHTVGDIWTFVIRPTPTNMALPTDNATFIELGAEWSTTESGLPGFEINDVEYIVDDFAGISRYVAVGSNGFISMSDDAATWTQLTLHDDYTDGTTLNGLGFGIVNSTTVVVVAGDDRLLGISDNFFNRKLEDAPIQGFSGKIFEVGFNPLTRLFTAVGEEAGLATSSDGRVWKMVFLDNAVANLRAVSVGDDELFQHMVVGDYGTFITSFDGKAWVTRDIGYTTGTIHVAISNATTTVVLAGDAGITQCSTDSGDTWTTVNSQFGQSDVRGGCFVSNSTTFVMVGNDGKIATSTNGSTWTLRASGITVDLVAAANRAGTNVVLAIAGNGTLLRSNDSGATWARLPTPNFVSDLTDIAASTTTWVATTSDGKIARSTNDGNSWEKVSIPIKPYLIRKTDPNSTELIDFTCVTFGGDVFVIGGSQGDVLVSTDANATAFVLKDSRLNGIPLQCLSFGQNTYLGGGERGGLVTSFTGFTENVLLSGGSPDSGISQSSSYKYNITGNSWSAGPGLNDARQYHSQQTLDDGTVLVAGGIDADGIPLSSTERYLPHRNIWVEDLVLPYAKGYLRGETLKDGAAVITGAGPDPFNSALVLLPAIVTPSPPRLAVGPGFLQPGVYSFRLAASTVAGETIPTEPVSITLTAQGGVVIDWDPVPNAVQYHIYGRDTGAADRIQIVPAHLTSYTDLGVEVTSAGTFRREDNNVDSWYELETEMPLPREGHGQSMIDKETILVTGGYNDRKTFRLRPNPYNFVKPAITADIEEGLYIDVDYTDDFYIEDNP